MTLADADVRDKLGLGPRESGGNGAEEPKFDYRANYDKLAKASVDAAATVGRVVAVVSAIGGFGARETCDNPATENKRSIVYGQTASVDELNTLLPCPNCHGRADYSMGIKNDKYYPYVECLSCALSTDLADSRQEAAQKWNRRSIPSLSPDMPAQELRLHMGEMSAHEERTARAAIRWANSVAQGNPPYAYPPVRLGERESVDRGLPMSAIRVGMKLRQVDNSHFPVITVTALTENGFTYKHERYFWRPGEWSDCGECYGAAGYSYYKEIEDGA